MKGTEVLINECAAFASWLPNLHLMLHSPLSLLFSLYMSSLFSHSINQLRMIGSANLS